MRSRTHAVRIVARLERMFPGLAKKTSALKKVLQATRGLNYPEFVEPKTWLTIGPGNRSEVEINADLLAAWIGHMSHSSRVRMELLEDTILRSLAQSQVIVPAMLTRAHIEAAAWAAYAHEELVKASDTASWVKFRSFVPKTLFGTAIAKEAKHLPEEAQDPLWLEVSSVMNAIDALDRFLNVVRTDDTRTVRVLYALLSDYAHPAIRGVRHLFEPIAETLDAWTIGYSCNERATSGEADLILSSLLMSMRLGHGVSLLMRLGTIEETELGFRYLKPDERDGMAVWQHVMLGATPREDA
jgi:hypothetical protein